MTQNSFRITTKKVITTQFYFLIIFICCITACNQYPEVKQTNEELLANNGIKSMIVRNENNHIIREESYFPDGKLKSYKNYLYPENTGQKIHSEGSFYKNGNQEKVTTYVYGCGVDNKGNSYLNVGAVNYEIFQKNTIKYNMKERPIEKVTYGNNGIRSYLLKYSWNKDVATMEEYQGNKGLSNKYTSYYDSHNNRVKSIDLIKNYCYQKREYKYNDMEDIVYEKSIAYNENGSMYSYFERKYNYKYNLDKKILQLTTYIKHDPKSEFGFEKDTHYIFNKKGKLVEVNEESSFLSSKKIIEYNSRGLVDLEKKIDSKGKLISSDKFTYYESGLLKTKIDKDQKLTSYSYIQ